MKKGKMETYADQIAVARLYKDNKDNITATFERIVNRKATKKEEKSISDLSLEYALISWNIDDEETMRVKLKELGNNDEKNEEKESFN